MFNENEFSEEKNAEEGFGFEENFDMEEDLTSAEGDSSSQEFTDKTLVCKECGSEFVFTAGEQEFYAEMGFQNEPQRCKPCRDARKKGEKGPRQYFTAVCAKCGGEARVPFEPREGREVYCSSCFEEIRQIQAV